jgi:hypothetical protein
MKEIYSTIAFDLQPGERVGIRVRRGRALSVSGERVWLTRSNDSADYFLHDGETMDLRAHELLWLSVDGEKGARLQFTLEAGSGNRLVDWMSDWWKQGPAGALTGSKLGLRIG